MRGAEPDFTNHARIRDVRGARERARPHAYAQPLTPTLTLAPTRAPPLCCLPSQEEPFVDCLDYVFLSRHWEATAADELPHRGQVVGPYPNATEPSDHVLLACDLAVSADRVGGN